MDKLKVVNKQKYDIGVVTLDKPIGINIRPGSFVMLSRDDVDYLCSICTLFQTGALRIDNADAEKEVLEGIGIDVETNGNFADIEDIESKLALPVKKLEAWLDTVTEPHMMDRVYDIAITKDISVAKMKVLKKKMPNKDFLGE